MVSMESELQHIPAQATRGWTLPLVNNQSHSTRISTTSTRSEPADSNYTTAATSTKPTNTNHNTQSVPNSMEPCHQATYIVINIQGMSPSATSKSRYKLPYFIEEHLQNDEVYIPYIALTETWLKSFITDAQIAIENYHTVRADRKKPE